MKLPTLQERQDRYVRRVFRLCGGNVGKTAHVLGIGRATTYRYLQRLGVDFEARVKKRQDELKLKARLAYFSREAKTL